MRARATAPGLFLVGLVLFALGVAWFETRTRAEALRRVEQHARAVEPALWNLDARLATDYFNLAAASYGYETITVSQPPDVLFLKSDGPKLRRSEAWLDRAGLLPRLTLTAPVVHDGTVIGSVRAVLISRNVYFESSVLLALVLLLVLAERSLQVVEGKRTLELRVTERTRQLAEREASHRQLTRLLDLAPDVIFVREAEGPVSYWNKGAEHLFGPGRPEELETRLRTVYAAAVAMDRDDGLHRAGLWVGEFDAPRPDGTHVRLHVSLSLTPDGAAGNSRVLFIATDITARRELEAHLLRIQRTQAVGTLASGVAHDFNNLLTPILLSTQLLESGNAPAAVVRSAVATIEQCARRGADLVRQLMNLSGSRPAQRTTVRLPELLADLLQLLQSTFPKSITLEHDWPADLPPLEADPANLHQAILNLCVNARDSMPDGGRLRLAAAASPGPPRHATAPDTPRTAWIRLTVSDTGTGIAPEIRERIFDPFFTTKETGKGTGLGLATVHRLVQDLGGFIELVSEVGHGAAFTLHLPSGGTGQSAPPPPAATPPPRGAGELILVVDDEPAVLETTARLLQTFGYRTLTADSGQAALARHAEQTDEIRAVLTDLMMPGLDGVALANALHARRPQLPIAVTTGLLNTANRARIASAGITVVLSKPYRPDRLLADLHRLLHQSA